MRAANRRRLARRSGQRAVVVLGACAILVPAGVGSATALGFPFHGAPTPGSQTPGAPAPGGPSPGYTPGAPSPGYTGGGEPSPPVSPTPSGPTAPEGGSGAGSTAPGIGISVGGIGISVGGGGVSVSVGGHEAGRSGGHYGEEHGTTGYGHTGTASPSPTTSESGTATTTSPTATAPTAEAGTTQTQAPEQSVAAAASATTATPTAAAASTSTTSTPPTGASTKAAHSKSSAANTKSSAASSRAASAHARRATQRAARSGRARRATGGHANASAAAAAAGAHAPADRSTVASLNGTSGPATTTRRGSPRQKTAPKPSKERLPPIVTTITKIVGIVPLSMRVLIAVLVALALAFAARSRFVARRARRLARQRGELLEDVGLLQAALLPVPPSRLGAVSTTAAYRPADGPGAGGDFYDVFGLEDGRLAVVVGDVSGHGRAALPRTALVRFTLRAYLEAGLAPRQAVQTAGAVLERQLGESFATAAVLTYQPADRTLTYASAGHPPPIVLGDDSSISPVTVCSAPPIGAGLRTGTRETVMTLPGSARVCVHTDGITEARVGSDLFGTERLRQTIAGLASDATATDLLDRVADQTDLRPDDMAACLLMVDGGAGAPAAVLEELELDGEQVGSERTEQFLLACGVPAGEIDEILRWARADAERTGSVTLKVRRGGGSPEVILAPNNVTSLQAASLKAQAAGAAL